MKLSKMTQQEKAKVLGSITHALADILDPGNTGETLFFTLIVQDDGCLANTTNISNSAIPRLLREYADAMENKHRRTGGS